MGGGRISAGQLFRLILLAAVAALAVGYGLRVREWAWHATQGVHFQGDISNGWSWGTRAIDRGLFGFYDDLELDLAAGYAGRKIDYPPLRLTVMTLWARWTRQHYPAAESWVDIYEFTAPMLHVNTTAELLAAVLVFGVILVVKRHMNGAWTWPGAVAGLFGGLLFWFNPAVIWDSHCWPQWDVWCLPFFFAAILCACLNRWFAAGAMIAIGACLKGQLLLVAPIFVLWPLFQFQFRAVVRFVCGFVTLGTAVALPWMNLTAFGVFIVLLGIGAIGAVWLIAWRYPNCRRVLPGELRWPITALACALVILSTLWLGLASKAWFTLGFVYGTQKFENMFTGSGSWNVPAMLIEYLQWDRRIDPDNPDDVVRLWWIGKTVSTHTTLRTIYFLTLIWCGLAAAIQHYRKDTRLLVALATPWLTMFMLMPQMHGRYSVWAAGACALLAGESLGLALLGVLVSVVAALGIVENQLLFRQDWWPDLILLLRRVDPHLGWVLLTAMGVQLYVALLPRRRLARRAEAEAVLKGEEVVKVD